MSLSLQRMLILITIKKQADLCWNSTDFEVSWVLSRRRPRLHSHSPPPSLFDPSVHLPSPVWGEVKPDQLVEERQCLSLDHRQRKRERTRRGGGSHHLLLTPAWQVILLNKGAHAQHERGNSERRGERERSTRDGALQQASELVKCWRV